MLKTINLKSTTKAALLSVSLAVAPIIGCAGTTLASTTWEKRDTTNAPKQVSYFLSEGCQLALNNQFEDAEESLSNAIYNVLKESVEINPDSIVDTFAKKMGLDNGPVKTTGALAISGQVQGYLQIMSAHLREVNQHFGLANLAVKFASMHADKQEKIALADYLDAIQGLRNKLLLDVADSYAKMLSSRVFCQDLVIKEVAAAQDVTKETSGHVQTSSGLNQAVVATLKQIIEGRHLDLKGEASADDYITNKLGALKGVYVEKNSLSIADLFANWDAVADKAVDAKLIERAKHVGGII